FLRGPVVAGEPVFGAAAPLVLRLRLRHGRRARAAHPALLRRAAAGTRAVGRGRGSRGGPGHAVPRHHHHGRGSGGEPVRHRDDRGKGIRGGGRATGRVPDQDLVGRIGVRPRRRVRAGRILFRSPAGQRAHRVGGGRRPGIRRDADGALRARYGGAVVRAGVSVGPLRAGTEEVAARQGDTAGTAAHPHHRPGVGTVVHRHRTIVPAHRRNRRPRRSHQRRYAVLHPGVVAGHRGRGVERDGVAGRGPRGPGVLRRTDASHPFHRVRRAEVT